MFKYNNNVIIDALFWPYASFYTINYNRSIFDNDLLYNFKTVFQ